MKDLEWVMIQMYIFNDVVNGKSSRVLILTLYCKFNVNNSLICSD